MKFAVTGGAGFIGSHLTNFLLKHDHEVIVIDNCINKKNKNLDTIKDSFEFHQVDVRDYEKLCLLLKNVDGIFHESGLTSVQDSFKHPDEYYSVNVQGSENIFKISQKLKIKTVFASSAAVYGPQTNVPIPENCLKNPANPYGQSKLDSENLVEKYKNNNKIIGLRYFNVYGPHQSSNYAGVIHNFLQKIREDKDLIIFGDGLQIRDFIHVDDVVLANYQAMKSSIDFGFFNIGSGNQTSIKDLAILMINISGKNLKIKFSPHSDGDVKLSQADILLAKNLLNWMPKTSLEDGLAELLSSTH